MKKSGNKDNGGLIRKSDRNVRAGHVGVPAAICAVLAMISVLAVFILFFVSTGSKDPKNPVVLFYGVDNGHGSAPDNYFPYASMRVALKGAGFDMAVLSSDASKDSESGSYIIPDEYKGRKTVVCACYQEAFYVMEDIYAKEGKSGSLEGFVLIMPYYPGNAAAAAVGRDKPDIDVAIFGKNDSNATVDKMSDSRMLFEKMSGVDTIYGTGIERDNLFASKIFVSAEGNRYLSMSFTSAPMRFQMALPSFQSELAGYLGTLYTGKLPYTAINVWNILLILSFFLGIASLFLYLYDIPVADSDNGGNILARRDGLVFIITAGLSAFTALGVIVMSLIPQTRSAACYLLCYAPTLMIAVMAVLNTPFILSNKVKYEAREGNLFSSVITAVAEVGLYVAVFLIFSGIADRQKSISGMISIPVIFIMDAMAIATLAFLDRKSRFGGLGGGSYFGTVLYPLLIAVPAVTAVVMGAITHDSVILGTGLLGIIQAIAPYLMAIPVKRNSDQFIIVGIIHGAASAVPLLLMM